MVKNDWDVTSIFRMRFNDLVLGHTDGLSDFPMQVTFCFSKCSQSYAQHYSFLYAMIFLLYQSTVWNWTASVIAWYKFRYTGPLGSSFNCLNLGNDICKTEHVHFAVNLVKYRMCSSYYTHHSQIPARPIQKRRTMWPITVTIKNTQVTPQYVLRLRVQ